jgi:GxxExxY protein
MDTQTKDNLVLPELSYEIMGLIFDVFNRLGYGYQEKYYQRALAEKLIEVGRKFKREAPIKIVFNNKIIGRYFIDFVIDDKVVIELKLSNDFHQKYLKQVFGYLKATGLPLGILVLITKDGIRSRRIVNTKVISVN